MNLSKTRAAFVLFPLMVAACDPDSQTPVEEGSGGAGGDGSSTSATTAGAGGDASPTAGSGGDGSTASSTTAGAGGAGGDGSTTNSTTAGAGGDGSTASSTTAGAGGQGGDGSTTAGAGGDGSTASSSSTAGAGGSDGSTTTTTTAGAGGSDGSSTTAGAGGADPTTTTTTAGAGGSDGSSTTAGAGGADPTATTTTAGAGGEGGSGEGGAGGQGGQGGSAPDPTDTCPGEAHTLVLDAPAIFIEGTTDGATDALDTCWSSPEYDGGDRIYAFALSGPGVLDVAMKHDVGVDPALVVRTSCTDDSDEYCHDLGEEGENHRVYRTDSTVYVIVDEKAGASGAFTLLVSLSSSVCGDGIVGPAEACDVGSGVAADGCGDPATQAGCQVELAEPVTDICPGELTPVPAGSSAILMSSGLTTLGHTDDAIGSCMPVTGGHDRVLQLVPAASGVLQVRAGMTDDGLSSMCESEPGAPGCFDVDLYARTACDSDDPADELACASSCCDGEAITFPVTADVPVYLFVDGYDQYFYSEGPFNLHFNLITD